MKETAANALTVVYVLTLLACLVYGHFSWFIITVLVHWVICYLLGFIGEAYKDFKK